MAKKADVNWELVTIVIALVILAVALLIYFASKGKITGLFGRLADILAFGGS